MTHYVHVRHTCMNLYIHTHAHTHTHTHSLTHTHTQVETFGSMERDEKVQFILEQMRLCLAKKDFIRTQIISKKISTKFFFNESDLVQVSGHPTTLLFDPSCFYNCFW